MDNQYWLLTVSYRYANNDEVLTENIAVNEHPVDWLIGINDTYNRKKAWAFKILFVIGITKEQYDKLS